MTLLKDEQSEGPYPVFSSSGSKSTHHKFMVSGPGVIVGRKGSLGTVFFSEEDYWPHDTTLWVKDFHGNCPRFAYYFLKTMGFERYDAGASNPTLNRNHIHTIVVNWPQRSTQQRIADILSAYDDLIENNLRRIKVLEEMVRALYREWFEELRFPGADKDRLVASPLGPIPKDWRVATLGEVATELRRNVAKGDLGGERPFVGLEHIPRRALALDAWDTVSAVGSNKLAFTKGDVLFGKIRPYFHKVSVAPFEGVCSADTIVINSRRPEDYAVVVACVSSDAFVAHATATSNGSKMPRANWSVMSEFKLVIPTGAVATRFSALLTSAIAQPQVLVFQNVNLRQTRDLLLPRLMSGQLSLGERD